MMILTYLTQLGLNNHEQSVRLSLYQLGIKPASLIAQYSKLDRTTTYKILLRLCDQGLAHSTTRKKTKYFVSLTIEELKQIIQRKREQRESLEDQFQEVEQELLALQPIITRRPKVHLFEGSSGIEQVCQDVEQEIDIHNYLTLSFFASNTFESVTKTQQSIGEYVQTLFDRLEKKNIITENYLGQGTKLIEHISASSNKLQLDTLPAGESEINIIIVGETTYFLLYKDIPLGIKITSQDISNLMSVLLKQASK